MPTPIEPEREITRAVGFLLTIGVSLLTEPPAAAEEEFDEVWQQIRRS